MLGCGAHVIALRRTAVAHYEASQMISIDKLEALAQCPHPKPEVASEQDVQKVDGADTEISQEPKSSDLTVQLVENFDVIDQLLLAMDTPIQALATVKIGEQETAFFQQGRAINIEPDLDQDMQQEQVVRVYQHSNSKFLGVATVKDIPMKSNTHTFTIHPKRVVVYQ
jgi:tRNA pseudouridine55 synthase